MSIIDKKEGIKMNLKLFKRLVVIEISVLIIFLSLLGCEHKEQLPMTSPEPSASDLISKTPEQSAEELKGEFTFAHFNEDEALRLVKAFNEKHPGVKINLKIEERLFYSRSDPFPDIVALETAFVKRIVNIQDGLEDLSSPPYNAEELTSKMIPFTVDVGRSNDGKIKALAFGAAPGAIGYKRDIARKYLGTDDPDAISEMLSSTEKIIETAKKLKENSGGKVKLIPGMHELMRIYLGGRSQGWVVEDTLCIDPLMIEYVNLQKQLRDMGQDGGMEAWTPQWSKAVDDDTHFMYAIPTWGIPYIIEINDTANKDTGRWGLAKPTYPYFWGGTWYGVVKEAEPERKKLAWEFLKFLCTDMEFLESYAELYGEFVNNTELIEKLSKDDRFINRTINQNPYEFFTQEY